MFNRNQKGVMISHRNVISNVLQLAAYERRFLDAMRTSISDSSYLEIVMGLLPQSHIYSLVVICHSTVYRGGQVINMPKFELKSFLEAIQRFKINSLILVSRLSYSNCV